VPDAGDELPECRHLLGVDEARLRRLQLAQGLIQQRLAQRERSPPHACARGVTLPPTLIQFH
jgi:hypothetical protein